MATAAAECGASLTPPKRLLFTATIFAGSFLLFLVQPLIGRLALPRLGGAPAVWNSAMLVYQTLLLAGYAYAHLLSRAAPRVQPAIHLCAFALAALLLPIGLRAGGPPDGLTIFLWVPWLLLVSIGPLFLLVSANSPLLQRWFAMSGGGDPYPLFAASNLGSFAGLLCYPLLLEPLLPVSDQRLIWTAGYALLFALLAGCSLILFKQGTGAPAADPAPLPERAQLARWTWLALIPSGLMLSTTLFLTTDLSPLPLLWVVPLGLYLLSFVIAFAARQAPAELVSIAAPYLLVPAAIGMFIGDGLPLMLSAGILLLALFGISTAVHHRLFQSRPDASQLTAFYLAVALGGALGGLFCALIAPLIFDWTYEYPLLLLAAAIAILPGYSPIVPSHWWDHRRAAPVVIGASAAAVIAALWFVMSPGHTELVRYAAVTVLAVAVLAVGSRPLMVALIVCAMLVCGGAGKLDRSRVPGAMTRTYFGVYSIVDHPSSRQLLHGTTLHGIQLKSPGWESFPSSYYAPESGIGQAMLQARGMFGPNAHVAVVGLGTGTIACYRRPGQQWTFFELDPKIVEIARTSGQFTFLARCAPDARIVLGDARLELAKQPPASVDILVVDAFSSDAVPMHLLTREAFASYARYLKPSGLLMMHISNRHLDLEPVVAAAPGWESRVGDWNPEWDYRQVTPSEWVAMSRDPNTIYALENRSGEIIWSRSGEKAVTWTDDRASLIPILKFTKP